MKLDFLDDLTDQGKYPDVDPDKVIRLYDFKPLEASQLKNVIESEIIGEKHEVDLSKINFVQSLNCSLKFKLSEEDIGIKLPTDKKNFICLLTLVRYQTMVKIIAEFTKPEGQDGYSWLYDPKESCVDLLFSPGGTW